MSTSCTATEEPKAQTTNTKSPNMSKARLVIDQGTKVWVQRKRLLLNSTGMDQGWPCVEGYAGFCNGMAMLPSCNLVHTCCTSGPRRKGRSQSHLRPHTRFMSQSCIWQLLTVCMSRHKKTARHLPLIENSLPYMQHATANLWWHALQERNTENAQLPDSHLTVVQSP